MAEPRNLTKDKGQEFARRQRDGLRAIGATEAEANAILRAAGPTWALRSVELARQMVRRACKEDSDVTWIAARSTEMLLIGAREADYKPQVVEDVFRSIHGARISFPDNPEAMRRLIEGALEVLGNTNLIAWDPNDEHG
jgi:hypothetical protein